MKNLGFIGMGNMAQALCSGFVKSGKIKAENIFAYAPNQQKLASNASKYGFTPCTNLKEVVQKSDTVIMACKPYQIEDVLAEIKADLAGKTLVSIALGWNFAKYSQVLDPKTRVQFVMPNTTIFTSAAFTITEIAFTRIQF